MSFDTLVVHRWNLVRVRICDLVVGMLYEFVYVT